MSDPFSLFQQWYTEAKASVAVDADAVALATCTANGAPSVRVLYYRRLLEGRFCFFTNFESHKGHDLETNPRAAMVFLWHMIGKQVNIEGSVVRLSEQESDDYFYQRAFESQLSAVTSKQSQKLTSFDDFLSEIEANRKKLGTKITRPKNWGGYGLSPQRIEFFQMGEHRRHRRELYIKDGDHWTAQGLYP